MCCVSGSELAEATIQHEYKDVVTRGYGPRSALKRVLAEAPEGVAKQRWIEESRVRAILGSCPRTRASALSGLRCWISFAQRMLYVKGNELPPSLEGLLAWSNLFRCEGTFSNYVGHVRLACELVRCDTSVFDRREVKRAKIAIRKRRQFVSRERTFLGLAEVRKLVLLVQSLPAVEQWSMLFLFTYTFLLRLPSEALPVVFDVGCDDRTRHLVTVDESEVRLWLPFRKNRLHGTALSRRCWCRSCPVTCPVHVLGRYLKSLYPGSRPFANITAGQALHTLRSMLLQAGIPNHNSFITHSLRRGHARDIHKNGGNLKEILEAGDWRSAAFMHYMDTQMLESDSVQEARGLLSDVLHESSDDDEDALVRELDSVLEQ